MNVQTSLHALNELHNSFVGVQHLPPSKYTICTVKHGDKTKLCFREFPKIGLVERVITFVKQNFLDPILTLFCYPSREHELSYLIGIVKVYYLNVDTERATLSDEERCKLLDLQEKINILGREHFCIKKNSFFSFLSAGNLSDYQVRHFPELSLVTKDTLKKGLPNRNAMTCWLNSALIFLAGTSYYDTHLSSPLNDTAHDALRQSLVRLINALRLDYDECVIADLHVEVLAQMEESGFSAYLTNQQDAAEFLLRLQNQFSATPPSEDTYIQLVTLYESDNPDIVKSASRPITSTRLIVEPDTSKDSVVVTRELERKSPVEGATSCFKKKSGKEITTPKNCHFNRFEAATYLPDTLELYIQRGVYLTPDVPAITIEDPLETSNSTIELFEYETVNETVGGQEVATSVRKKTRCLYKIEAAIEHQGETNDKGHWVATLQGPNDSPQRISDQKLSKIAVSEAWKKASLLMLTLISKKTL